MTLTVLTWLWSQPGGRTQFNADHVGIWSDMVRRHLKQPHRLACVTDMPDGIPSHVEIIAPPREFEHVRIPSWGPDRPQCLRRLSMFAPNAAKTFGERFACMDLDCVIGGPLDPLFDTDADFKIAAGTARGRPYNGSLMLLRAGTRTQVYDKFTPLGAAVAGRRFVGSDQAWISHILGPNEAVWTIDDGVVWQNGWRGPDAAVMFYPGPTKPWTVVELGDDAWTIEHYRRDPQGRCLVLGYEANVWNDAEAAIAEGPYNAVLASPEAAEHWPGEILAVAKTNASAARMARMYGFNDVAWCGLKEAA